MFAITTHSLPRFLEMGRLGLNWQSKSGFVQYPHSYHAQCIAVWHVLCTSGKPAFLRDKLFHPPCNSNAKEKSKKNPKTASPTISLKVNTIISQFLSFCIVYFIQSAGALSKSRTERKVSSLLSLSTPQTNAAIPSLLICRILSPLVITFSSKSLQISAITSGVTQLHSVKCLHSPQVLLIFQLLSIVYLLARSIAVFSSSRIILSMQELPFASSGIAKTLSRLFTSAAP